MAENFSFFAKKMETIVVCYVLCSTYAGTGNPHIVRPLEYLPTTDFSLYCICSLLLYLSLKRTVQLAQFFFTTKLCTMRGFPEQTLIECIYNTTN